MLNSNLHFAFPSFFFSWPLLFFHHYYIFSWSRACFLSFFYQFQPLKLSIQSDAANTFPKHKTCNPNGWMVYGYGTGYYLSFRWLIGRKKGGYPAKLLSCIIQIKISLQFDHKTLICFFNQLQSFRFPVSEYHFFTLLQHKNIIILLNRPSSNVMCADLQLPAWSNTRDTRYIITRISHVCILHMSI